jgi:hypothetical protein
MKWEKRYIICSLLAGLTVLINSCKEKETAIKLLASKTLSFPSASAIEFYNNHLYLLGDDAPYLLILDTAYNLVDTVQYIQTKDVRLSKSIKPDIESAFIHQENGATLLAGIGSMSTSNRFVNFLFDTDRRTLEADTTFFNNNIIFPGIKEINIEGSAMVTGRIVFANRANNDNPKNHLIIYNEKKEPFISELILKEGSKVIGVSGLHYLKEKGLLFFTASIENTSDASVDGAIGDSYVGWIDRYTKKMKDEVITPTQMVNLSSLFPEFKKQKVESVCVESWKESQMLLHLVADNDDGNSKIFKLKLVL